MRGSTAFCFEASGKEKTRFPVKPRPKTYYAALLRSRVNMVKLRSVSAFTLSLKPSYEYCLTRLAEKFAN